MAGGWRWLKWSVCIVGLATGGYAGAIEDVSQTQSTAPYLPSDAAVYEITPSEYQDLRTYMDQAQETLERTLKESRALNGEDLHARLLDGIQSALAQSGLKNELLLFRYVLNRAPELDAIFQGAFSDAPRLQTDAQAVASNAILISSIRLALEYYKTRDLPRVGPTQIPTPDWVQFSKDQIWVLLRIADLAPDAATKREIVIRALGWTARALNSDPERRSMSKSIGSLGDMLLGLQNRTRTVKQAQRLMIEVRADLESALQRKKPQKSGNGEAAAGPTPEGIEFPRKSTPIAGAVKPTTLLDQLPLGKEDPNAGLGTQLATYCSRTKSGTSDGNVLMELGVAGGAVGSQSMSAYTQAEFLGALIWGLGGYCTNVTGYFFDLFSQWKVGVGAATGANPLIYEVQASVSASAVGILGGFATFEINQYPGLSEVLARVGWAPQLVLYLGDRSYLVVQFQLGFDAYGAGQSTEQALSRTQFYGAKGPFLERVAGGGGSIGGEAWLQVAKWVFAASFHNDGLGLLERRAAKVSISIPVGLISAADALRLEGQLIHLYDGDPARTIFVKKIGATYEIKF